MTTLRPRPKRPLSFWLPGSVFAAFVVFLYGPMFAICVLSFQGPEGGLTFPLRGVSLHWFQVLWQGIGVIDIGAAFRRSLALGLMFRLLDTGLKFWLDAWWPAAGEALTTTLGLFTSGLGAQLTWTLPFGLQGLTTTVTTPVISFLVMGLTLATVWLWQRRRRAA